VSLYIIPSHVHSLTVHCTPSDASLTLPITVHTYSHAHTNTYAHICMHMYTYVHTHTCTAGRIGSLTANVQFVFGTVTTSLCMYTHTTFTCTRTQRSPTHTHNSAKNQLYHNKCSSWIWIIQ